MTLVVNGSYFTAPLTAGMMDIGTDLTNAGYDVYFVDLVSNGQIERGDYFLVTNPPGAAGAAMFLSLIYGEAGANIATAQWEGR